MEKGYSCTGTCINAEKCRIYIIIIIMEGGLGNMKQILQKGADFTLSVMEAVAVVFANCQCIGRAYEPEMPDELKQDDQN